MEGVGERTARIDRLGGSGLLVTGAAERVAKQLKLRG